MTQYGISESILKLITTTCQTFPAVKHVIIYGSRARGDYKLGSDIDLAIDAPNMDSSTFSRLWNALDDLPIIYSMDIVHLQSLQNKPLRNAIQREGCIIWP